MAVTATDAEVNAAKMKMFHSASFLFDTLSSLVKLA